MHRLRVLLASVVSCAGPNPSATSVAAAVVASASAASTTPADADTTAATEAAAAAEPEGAAPAGAPPRPSWSWVPTTEDHLRFYETRLLARLGTPYTIDDVAIDAPSLGPGAHHIRTLHAPRQGGAVSGGGGAEAAGGADDPPLVLLHGMGGAAVTWVRNVAALARRYNVYAVDLPGFAGSSRVAFERNSPPAVEQQLVDALEAWRRAHGLDRFVLVGHSFGGYVASAYALQHPSRVAHLVLADPWGLPERPDDSNVTAAGRRPGFVFRALISTLGKMPPFFLLRATGPWGEKLLRRTRQDLAQAFDPSGEDHEDFFGWLYHANAQKPSGELAFHALHVPVGWAATPMLPRLADLHDEMPLTFMYGKRSFISASSGHEARELRREKAAPVDLHMLNGTHHFIWQSPGEVHSVLLNLRVPQPPPTPTHVDVL